MDHFLAICGAVALLYAGAPLVPDQVAALGVPEAAAVTAGVGAILGYAVYDLLRRVGARR